MSSQMEAAEVTATRGTESGFVQLLRRYPLISYFVMAYAISWFYVIAFQIIAFGRCSSPVQTPPGARFFNSSFPTR